MLFNHGCFSLVCVLFNEIHVFSFPVNPECLYTLNTRENPSGLVDLTPLTSPDQQLLVFPGMKKGTVQLVVSSTAS